jgi:hypothetical protein
MAKTQVKGAKNQKAYTCGTPFNDCLGALNKNGGLHKVHRSREEARKCYVKYLVKIRHCTRLKTDQFYDPEMDTVLIVTKVSKYGGRMKGEGPKGKGRFVKHKDSECFI